MRTPNADGEELTATLILGRGVGGEHVERVTVAWTSDDRPLTIEFDTQLLSAARQRAIWQLLEQALAEDPTARPVQRARLRAIQGNPEAPPPSKEVKNARNRHTRLRLTGR